MHPEPNSSRPACSPVLAFSSTETEIKEIPFPLLLRKNQTNKYTALSRTIITNHIIYSINQKNILKKSQPPRAKLQSLIPSIQLPIAKPQKIPQ